jgi:hypothetical protein
MVDISTLVDNSGAATSGKGGGVALTTVSTFEAAGTGVLATTLGFWVEIFAIFASGAAPAVDAHAPMLF